MNCIYTLAFIHQNTTPRFSPQEQAFRYQSSVICHSQNQTTLFKTIHIFCNYLNNYNVKIKQ